MICSESPETASPEPQILSRWLVAALMTATFVNFLGSLALGPFLPQVAHDLGTTVALVGQVPALVTMLAALLGLVVGPLADHYGSGRSLMIGVLAATASTLAVGLAPTYALLLLVTIIGAIGRATIQPTAQATVAHHFPDEATRRYAMSRVQMGQSGAAIIGIPILTYVAVLWSWRLALVMLAVFGLISLLVLWRTLPSDERTTSGRIHLRSALASYVPLLRHRSTLSIIVGTLVGNIGTWIVWSYLAAFLIEVHHFTVQEAGWVYLFGGGGVMVGTMISSTRVSANPRGLMIVSRVVAGLLVSCAMILPLPGLAVMGVMSLAMVMHGLYGVPNLLVLSAESPAGRATTMTLNASAISLATALGGVVGGIALSLGGYSALGVCAPIFPLVGSAIIWWSRPRAAPPLTLAESPGTASLA
jgi:MFS transporter, DHA1 family, inner membrane transport protein